MKQILRILEQISKVLICIVAGVAIYGVVVTLLARFTSWGD